MCRYDRGVDVETQLESEIGLRPRRPGGGSRAGPSPAKAEEVGGAHPVEHPPGGRLGGDRAEEARLVPENLEVADRVGPVGDGNGEVGKDAARVMDRHALVGADEDLVPGVDQPGEAGQLSEQLGPGVGDDTVPVGSDSHLRQPTATLVHLEGAFP
jgi:hypothetical protein